jgi:hypothetical protein
MTLALLCCNENAECPQWTHTYDYEDVHGGFPGGVRIVKNVCRRGVKAMTGQG